MAASSKQTATNRDARLDGDWGSGIQLEGYVGWSAATSAQLESWIKPPVRTARAAR